MDIDTGGHESGRMTLLINDDREVEADIMKEDVLKDRQRMKSGITGYVHHIFGERKP